MLAPGLSMLWEPDEPEQALRERFGFAEFEAAADWIRRTLAETWGRTMRDCSRVLISSANAIAFVSTDSGPCVVKWSVDHESFDRLDHCTRLVGRLARRGLSIAAPVASLAGEERIVVPGPRAELSVAVLPEVSGEWLCMADELAVRAAGAELARLHDALADESATSPPVPIRPGLEELIRWWLAEADHGLAPTESRRLETLLAEVPELDDAPQLLHGDFRAANVLTRNSAVVAVLDFDDVQVGHRVDDLARASVHLATRFRDWQPTPAPVRAVFVAGYESVRELTASERAWLQLGTLGYGLAAVDQHGSPERWLAAL